MTEIQRFFLHLRSLFATRASGLDAWWLDTKLGLRMLVKYPGLALAAGVGIAVAVAIFVAGSSVIHGAFLVSTLPLEEGERIVSLEVWDSVAHHPERRLLRDFQSWRDELRSVEDLSAFRTFTPNLLSAGTPPGSVRVAAMSASGFRVARVRPLLGRYLMDDDERAGAPLVVVIGESVWRNRFAADPAITGRTIHLGGTAYSIAGVMPETFAFPVNHQMWVALRTDATAPAPLTGPELMAFGRLARGATLESAQAELTAAGQRRSQSDPEFYAKLSPRVMPYAYPFAGLHDVSDVSGIQLMQGLSTSLLVLVCLNVAILVYSRTATRQREIAVRTALGASRRRIVAQLFIEALVLSTVAALAGVGIAAVGIHHADGALRSVADELPFWISFQLSPGAVLSAAALSVLAAAIVGIVPALKATRRDMQTGMRLGKTWTTLIVAQVGLAVALLPAAVFSVWESARRGLADPGFAAEQFLSVELGQDTGLSAERETATQYARRQTELMRRLEDEPLVSGVTFATANPGSEPSAQIETEGERSSAHETQVNSVDINFFRVFEVPILAGRGFASADVVMISGESSGAVVVNQTFAERVFGGKALGQRIRYSKGDGRWHEIIGIVRDFPSEAGAGIADSKLKMYHAMTAGQVVPVSIELRIRSGGALPFAGRLREIAAAVDPGLQLHNLSSLAETLRREQWIRLVEGAVFAAVTCSVLLLSAAGIYALMSLTVSRRRKEIGIRAALGADPKRLIAGIFSQALGQLAIGAGLGMAVAAILDRALWGDLMRGHMGVILPVVALLVMAVGAAGTLGPARRSLRIQPTEALREQ